MINPATSEKLAEQAPTIVADVDRAVAATWAAHQSGEVSGMRQVLRGQMVQAMGHYLLQVKAEIAHILTLEQGKPLWGAVIEGEGAARYCEYYVNQAETIERRSVPFGANYLDFTTYEPIGVSAQIIPWNHLLDKTARS